MKKKVYKIGSCSVLLALLCSWQPQIQAQGLAYEAHHSQSAPRKSSNAATLSIKDALKTLREHYKVDILFSDQAVNDLAVPENSIRLNQSLEQNLETVLKSFGLGYSKSKDGTYLITPAVKSEKQAPSQPAASGAKVSQVVQMMTVTGSVTDEKGVGLPGVTVILKGTTNGAATDATGTFSLNVPDGNGTLVVSYIGFKAQEVPINNRSSVNITLEPDAKALEEVIVVGYGTQRKRDITSAVSNINMEDVGEVPASNVTQLIQGQAPGVVVKQNNGSPGSEFEVKIRGIGSLGAGSSPLYVIDGFPVGTSVGQNLNPNDIESISVLKDAASTAIYGARGSNGVILITTKHAKEGEVNVNVTANYGIQNIPDSRKVKMLNGVEFAQFKKDVFMDKIRYFENREPTIEEVPLDFRYPEQTKYSTNWFEEILNQNAAVQNYNVTLSEGKGPIHSLISADYFNQEGALIKTNYDRFSLRSNLGGKLNDYITMGWNINGSYSRQNLTNPNGRDALIGSALIMDPREPVYNEDGTYNSYIGGNDGVFGWPNPVQSLNEIVRSRNIGDVLSNGFIEISFLKNFKFKSAVNARVIFDDYKEFVPSTIAGTNAPPPRQARGYESSFQTLNVSADQLLTYNNEFGDHHLDAMVGYTAQEENTKGLSGSGNNYPDDFVPYLNAAILKSSGSTEYGWSTLAYLSRINYSFKDKYLLSASFNREGSSRFGVKNKWGNFPAASVAWRISEEPFIPKYSWLEDLKIRGSWGMTGNNNIGNYSSLSYMSTINYILGNNIANGKVISSFANAELGWEKSQQVDIGLDLATFNNKLVFTVEYYKKITNDMLLPIQIPSISGFTTSLSNIGKVENKGFEFAVDYRTAINEFNFRTNFNISFNRNEVLELRGENDEIWNGGMYDMMSVSKVGRPIGMIYGFEVLGIFDNQAEIDAAPAQDGAIPGVYRYMDGDGDGRVSYDQQDMVEIGNPHPDFNWGWTVGGDYKRFDFNVLFLGAQGYDVFAQIEKSTMNLDGVFNILTESKDRWRSEQNPGAGKLGTTNTWIYSRESNSRYVYDASHMWVKNVTLGYTLPNIGSFIKSARIYLNADNLLLISNYPGNNPDVNALGGIRPGFDDVTYPVARTFSFGANLNF